MESLRTPLGELPPEVYWRRRLLSIGIFVLAVVVVFFLIKATAADGSAPSASSSPTPDASPSASVGAVTPCGPEDVTVTLAPTPRNYAGGATPVFAATVAATGSASCTLDTGSADLQLLVTSGSDRIWASTDCETTALLAPEVLTVGPGAERELTVTWGRYRSNEACQTNLPAPLPGTYRAVLTIQGITSTTAVFGLDA